MSLFTEIRIGEPLPNVQVAELVGGDVSTVDLQVFCGNRNLVVIGVPGAFMPSCTRLHLPDFVRKAPALKAAGIDDIVCIAPDNPLGPRRPGRTARPGTASAFPLGRQP